MNIQQTALMQFLSHKDQAYAGKASELREAIQGWLGYIPQTFPHYTRHTIEHSEEIIGQLSQILFYESDPEQPVLKHFSGVEAYALIAAAYLHDAGMVASDRSKQQILSSPEWQTWTTEGGGKHRWNEIDGFRNGDTPPDSTLRHFIADIQVRHLIAEFVRRNHHLRAADIITENQHHFGRFAFDDPALLRTISQICVAHGLRQYELEDQERYPFRRNIRGETINVRLMAILLRIGDLLDMSYNRACPLLLNAASPLPPDSLAHWTQYQRIVHRLSAPDQIEITAECETQEEHRFLQDWCQWLVKELNDAAAIMARAERHQNWTPPKATLGPQGTITIRPASNANYIPGTWSFELDNEAIFQRLIYDTYADENDFIRELIQNASDANRCQMYHDLEKEGQTCPEFPTEVNETRRQRYLIEIRLTSIKQKNSLSGETEEKQILVIEDHGIGMDQDIIQRYFLQIGRSYYKTEDFKRKFAFIPTSQFGIGFLSVFAVSNEISIETFKPSNGPTAQPIKLTLTGPRNYLLTETGNRNTPGTRIAITLQKPLAQGQITKIVSNWCKRLEFPVLVDDLGEQTTVEAENSEQYICEEPDLSEEGAKFVIRTFPLNIKGKEGEIYIFARITEEGESWTSHFWAEHTYLAEFPQASIPDLPPSYTCLNGIRIGGKLFEMRDVACQIDFRGTDIQPITSRNTQKRFHSSIPQSLKDKLYEIVQNHLDTTPCAQGDNGVRYKQRLAEKFENIEFWAKVPDTIKLHDETGQVYYCSLDEACQIPYLSVIFYQDSYIFKSYVKHSEIIWQNVRNPVLIDYDLIQLPDYFRSTIFSTRKVKSIQGSKGYINCDWELMPSDKNLAPSLLMDNTYLCTIPNFDGIGIQTHSVGQTYTKAIILNSQNIIVEWFIKFEKACIEQKHNLTRANILQTSRILRESISYYKVKPLISHLQGWRNASQIPPELRPPDIEITQKMFQFGATNYTPTEEPD